MKNFTNMMLKIKNNEFMFPAEFADEAAQLYGWSEVNNEKVSDTERIFVADHSTIVTAVPMLEWGAMVHNAMMAAA